MGHDDFSIEAMRWTLATLKRGQHVVLKNVDAGVYAVGWSDYHYKCYITTHGSTDQGDPAPKKRQRANGRNYRIQVDLVFTDFYQF